MSTINPEIKMKNDAVLANGLLSDDLMQQKEAAGKLNRALRIKLRDDGIFRGILPPVAVSEAELDAQVDTDLPAIIREIEPNSAGAVSMPIGGVPMSTYMEIEKYRVEFDTIMSKAYVADTRVLRTTKSDLKGMFYDLMLKDVMDEEDRKFLVSTEYGLRIKANGTLASSDPYDGSTTKQTDYAATLRYLRTGCAGYITAGTWGLDAIQKTAVALPSCSQSLNPAVVLMNNVTITKFMTLPQVVVGSIVEDTVINGVSQKKIGGMNIRTTVKKNLVPNAVAYIYTAPEFLGDFYTFDDVTVSTEVKNTAFRMFAYETIGGAIKNMAGIAKVKFVNGADTDVSTDGSKEWGMEDAGTIAS